MPELPEVEICRRNLEAWTRGRTIASVEVPDPGAVRSRWATSPSAAAEDGAAELEKRVRGAVACAPLRRGKRIVWDLHGGTVGLHLGMTGKWVRRDAAAEAPRHGRVALVRGDGTRLWFVDSRRFGAVVLVSRPAATEVAEGLGPDALLSPPTGPELAATVVGRRAIKVALMDQQLLAGLGNIHVAEALFRAGVHPGTPAGRVAPDAWDRLAVEIPKQLEETVARDMADEVIYLTESGAESPFRVYGRAGKPCFRCGAVLESARMGGRATVWCPACQPAVV